MKSREDSFREWIGSGRDVAVTLKGCDARMLGRLTQHRNGMRLAHPDGATYWYFEMEDLFCVYPGSVVSLTHHAERQIRSQEEDAEETFGYGIDQARRALLAAGIPLDVIDSVVGVTADYGSQAYMRGHSRGFNQGVQWQKERQ
jgi:hypothetical protein